MHYVSGSYTQLNQSEKNQLFKYRHEVFVGQLGWELETPNGLDIDQYDHEKTMYVIAKNDQSDVVGCARLLPTTEPYLLEEIFPELMEGNDLPKSSDIWEISRFSAFDLGTDVGGRTGHQFSSKAAIELLRATIQCAIRRGAKKIISVSPIGIERLLRAAGFAAKRAGSPKNIDGHSLFACWIELQEPGVTEAAA